MRFPIETEVNLTLRLNRDQVFNESRLNLDQNVNEHRQSLEQKRFELPECHINLGVVKSVTKRLHYFLLLLNG